MPAVLGWDLQRQQLLCSFILCLDTMMSQGLFQAEGENWPNEVGLLRCNEQGLSHHTHTHLQSLNSVMLGDKMHSGVQFILV